MPYISILLWTARCLLCVCVLAAQTAPYEQAMALVKAGDFEQAIPVLRQLVKVNSTDLRARNLLGIALTGVGRRAEANTHFEQLLKSNPRFVPALKNLAHNQLELGDLPNARRNFDAALQLAPADPSIHFGLAQVAFLDGDYVRAVPHFEKSNGMHLEEPLALVRYAASCAEAGMHEKALQALSVLPKQGAPALQFEAGVVLSKLERYDEAAARFELAHNGSADPSKSGFNLALAYLKSGSEAAAIRVLEELQKTHPSAELLSLLAEAYEKAGRTKDAYDALRVAIKLSQQDERAYVQLVALCLDHENQELGLEIADLGVTMLPGSARLRLQRGVIHALDSRAKEALADFAAARKLSPGAPLAYVADALLLLRIDRNADAVALLRARVNAQPEDYLANWMLAEALLKSGLDSAEAEALSALERSVRTNGRLAQSRMLLGKLLLGRGDAERAQRELEAALRLDASNVTASYLLGQVYRKQGKTEEANRLFAVVSAAKAEDPERSNSKAVLRIVREGAGARQ